MKKVKKVKKVPFFWIDGDWRGGELVGWLIESDVEDYPVIARNLTYEQAEVLLDNLHAGRVDFRRI